MAATTTLLGLVTPTQGTLSGTWGDTVNYGISDYVDISVAGTLTLTNDGAVTLANTTGSSSGNSITSSLTGAGTVTAQFAIVRVTGTLTVAKVVTGPSYSKTYTVVNAATGGIVTFKASGQTGVSVAVGESAFVYFNGTDYVKIVGTATAGAAGGSTTQVQYNNAGVLAGITGATTNGTALTLVAPNLGSPASVGTMPAFTLGGTVSGGGNQINNVIIGTSTPLAGTFTQLDITAQGPLRLQDTTGGEYVGLRSPASLGASYTLTFPADDGTSGQALITDGSGVLSWSTAASGDVYGPASATANGIALFDSTTGKLLKDSAATDGLIYGITVGRGLAGVGTNTAFGVTALAANTTGANNTAVGYQALKVNTTGEYNVAVGTDSLKSNTTGGFNVSAGRESMATNTSGANNSAFGYASLVLNTTGANNVAVGMQALVSNTTASNNTAVGYQAGYSNTTGIAVNAFGYQALYANTTGKGNSAFGGLIAAEYDAALKNNSTGNYNAAFASGALAGNTTGVSNTAVGVAAMYTNTTASYNTAVGYQAGYGNTTGAANLFVGAQTGTSNTTGSYNSFAGGQDSGTYTAGFSNTTGSSNTAFGSAALAKNTTASENTAVGYQAGYSNTTAGANLAVGAYALRSNTTGTRNTALGVSALYTSTASTSNVAIGYQTAYATTSGAYNVAIGAPDAGTASTFTQNTTGSANTAIGAGALNANTTASNNTAVGYQAGYLNQTGDACVYIGRGAGYTSTAGRFNTFVGDEAGGLTTGSNNAFFGNDSGYSVTTGTKNTILGSYGGNDGVLDIRTLSNYVVLSDGDGNVVMNVQNGSSIALKGAITKLGTGITFPATQNAASDANTLDDYEEGTWTPTIQGGTTAGTYTYEAVRTGGKYTKVGNMVTVWASFRIDTITTAGTGELRIGGLPFSSGSRMAPSWDNSNSLMVNIYGSGVNASAATYPPPLISRLNDGVTSFDVTSFGKNYAVATVIGDLSGADWIYTISGSYTTT